MTLAVGVSTAQAEDRALISAPVEVAMVPRDEEPSRPRRGRPPGTKGSQIVRVKRRLALLVMTGKRTAHLAKAFGVSDRTIRIWLADAEVQEEIRTLEQEFRQRTERQLMCAFLKSINAVEQLITGRPPKKGYGRPSLRAIKILWTALGWLPPKGAHVTVTRCNHNVAAGTPHRSHPRPLFTR